MKPLRLNSYGGELVDDATDVYHVWDADWNELYVGISSNAFRRFSEHARSSAWWPRADFIRIDRYEDRWTARKTEAVLIAIGEPEFNIALDELAFDAGWTDIHNGIYKYPTIAEYEFPIEFLRGVKSWLRPA
jgi:hypothetical protein